MKTERLVLKLYAQKDKNDLLNLFTDEVVMKHVDKGVLTRKQAEDLWRRLFEKFYAENLTTIWAVFAREDFRYVGHASLRPRPEKPADWEIGYILKKEEWEQGFATEIARFLVNFGLDELNLPKIFATVDDDNFSSIRVAEKAGMKFLRYEFDGQGRFSVYSIEKLTAENTEEDIKNSL